MKRLLAPLLIALASPAALADDGVATARAAAAAAWPAAHITVSSPAAPCPTDTVADAPGALRNGLTQVRVRCAASPGWVRYIALRVEQTALVAVLRTPLARGQTLGAEHIDWQRRDLARQSSDVLTEATPPTARMARRDLAAGTVLSAAQFTAPQAIQRGQVITLVSRAAGMEVRAPGEALADAALGARVRVRNSASRRIVEGIARDDGTVEVAL